MARPIKKGLEYLPMDTDFFADKKIRLLRGEFGAIAGDILQDIRHGRLLGEL